MFVFPTAAHIYEFHIFTVIYSPLWGFIGKQNIDQLPIGLLAQFLECCTGIADVVGSNPIWAWIFLRLIFFTAY